MITQKRWGKIILWRSKKDVPAGRLYNKRKQKTGLLEVDRHDLFDLMAKHDIPMANFPPEEFQCQLEYAGKKVKK